MRRMEPVPPPLIESRAASCLTGPIVHGVPPRPAGPAAAHSVLTTVSTTAAEDRRGRLGHLSTLRDDLARWEPCGIPPGGANRAVPGDSIPPPNRRPSLVGVTPGRRVVTLDWVAGCHTLGVVNVGGCLRPELLRNPRQDL